MSANPQALPQDDPRLANDAEFMAQLAAQLRGATASQFLNAALHGLSPQETALIPEVAGTPKAEPIWEGDASIKIGSATVDFGCSVFGRKIPAVAATPTQKAEPAFIDIDDVVIYGGGRDISIYDALSWADLQNISDSILAGGEL